MSTSPFEYHRQDQASRTQSPWPVAAALIGAFVGVMFLVLFVF